MSAEPRRIARPEAWSRWEGQVVNGIFPLLRFIGGSERGAVFLSEYNAGKTVNVAIKLVPGIGPRADAQLANWRAAAGLAHPHLVRLFDMGRCQLEGREFLFVVMEYGEQTLAQFLSDHALAADEVRAVLLPTLDALTFLHGSQRAHARLKPSNLLVVNDQLKLTSDSIRPAGQSGVATTDDIWCLGMILVEAFTQRTLEPDQPYETSPLLADVPPPFANAVRRCLNPNPDSRPTAAELRTQFEAVRTEPLAQDDDRRQAHPLLLAIPAAFLVLFAALIGPSTSDESQADLQSAAAVPEPEPEPEPTPPPAPARTRAPAAVPAPAPASTSSAPVAKPAASKPKPSGSISRASTPVVAEVIPEVPRALRDKVQGRILVRMRVLVDPSGNVMAAMMESSGPNKNLANLADRAAREWKFVPAEREDTRVWILTFAFTREGVTARATAV